MSTKVAHRSAEITKKEVAEACQKLQKRGEAVSRRSVLSELGKGSMTTINRLMQQIEDEGEQLTNKTGLPKKVKEAAKILTQAGEQAKNLQKECSYLRKSLLDMSKELDEMRDKNQALLAENRELKGKVARLSIQLQRAEEDQKAVQIGLELF